jgi:hypothetical protein
MPRRSTLAHMIFTAHALRHTQEGFSSLIGAVENAKPPDEALRTIDGFFLASAFSQNLAEY